MKDLRQAMHLQLAVHGIVLEETKPPKKAPEPTQAAPLDRGKIRRILIERGAHPSDLWWLARSCPSMEAAMAYRPWRRDEKK